MPSLFNTTAELQHTTPIPDGVPAQKGVELLQGYEFFIKCDPHMIKYEALAEQPEPVPTIPPERGHVATGAPKCYQVTDKVSTLPAGLWDSDVVSTYEFLNIEKGVFVRIRSPLNVVMETVWEVKEGPGGGLVLSEDILIKCSRLLAPVIKGTCESGWKGIHEKMTNKLKETGAS
ncbi:hypothetical protein NLU13_2283 [Sarocladium strictum]|uniref:DUF7053 domain-containing protein n=1 Tax=Sarocladium strictum TaxID=5046 RepID=A0AA39GU26_SARSR|nr:hypothetical protein NLU13_2283 [Sarocladium strictum]